jgi:gliding motility-associated-like protein
MSRKLSLLLALFLTCVSAERFAAQSQIAIVLNEYSASNITGPTDNYGQHSDWVEIRNAHTSSVSLGGYYLSNDRFNQFKWQIPSSFVMQPGELKLIWLSGRNTVSGGQYHANFTLEQCKKQWLILSTSTGVIRDSVLLQKTMGDHTRGRVDNTILGMNGWKLYTQHSALQENPTQNNYIDYAPTPQIFVETETNYTATPNKGGFFDGPQIIKIRLNGLTYDTTLHKCFNVFYTLSDPGVSTEYPQEVYPSADPYRQYHDSVNSPFTIDKTTVVRAIAVPNQTNTGCPKAYLPSFCETNTYFIDPEHQTFDPNFGVVSLTFDKATNNWFETFGNPPSSTIHVEYYDKKGQVSEGYGIINKPPQEEWRTKQKGFYISIDDKRGFGCNFEGNIFNVEVLGTTTRTVFETLHLYAGDMESHSLKLAGSEPKSWGTGLRDIFSQSLAAKYKLNVSPLHIKPVVTLKDGKYYGVFNWKEVYDKYYESYYYGQLRDSVDLNFVHAGVESSVSYPDGSVSKTGETWRPDVYDIATTRPMNSKLYYDQVMSKLDKESLIDYSILNAFAMNSDLWSYNVAFGKGTLKDRPGGKWHYYLWNMPTTYNFTMVTAVTSGFTNAGVSPCVYFSGPSDQISSMSRAYNGHGNILRRLMTTNDNAGLACGQFQLQYRNRSMDLMNGPFKCETILAHFDAIYNLYKKEMKYHEDPANQGPFATEVDRWDTNMIGKSGFRKVLDARCFSYFSSFSKQGCFGLVGPFPLSIDVRPEGSGFVKLNSVVLDEYLWTGHYYSTNLSLKAIPSNTTYAFHHWEFSQQAPTGPLSMDSIGLDFAAGNDIVAVFTDKTRDISFDGEANLPTGFSPNGDGLNDMFRPLGAGEYAKNYQMTIWSRWGQEVFRSVDPLVGWDGTFKGQQAVTGVYAYIITYTNTFGEEKMVKGNVTLTR